MKILQRLRVKDHYINTEQIEAIRTEVPALINFKSTYESINC